VSAAKNRFEQICYQNCLESLETVTFVFLPNKKVRSIVKLHKLLYKLIKNIGLIAFADQIALCEFGFFNETSFC